jgi:hypothetical protein
VCGRTSMLEGGAMGMKSEMARLTLARKIAAIGEPHRDA